MRQAFWTFLTLLSHWRRHGANLATLLIGLAIATALWSGVQALNAHARHSYAEAARLFSEGGRGSLTSARGGLFSQELFIRLRRAGWKVSPALEGNVRVGAHLLRIVGVEPLTLPHDASAVRVSDARGLDAFLKPPGRGYVAPQTLREIGADAGATLTTERGRQLPPLFAREGTPAGAIVVDIGVAQQILGEPERLSRLLLVEEPGPDAPPLQAIAGDALSFVARGEDGDLDRLTDSFHLNLTAFGFLSFLVGLFIVHASYSLAFEQRLAMVRTLRAVGVSAYALAAAMLAELLTLAFLAGGAGMALGYGIAAALLPNVAGTLAGLYGAQVSGQLALQPSWWAAGLAMAALGALAAAAAGLAKTLRLPTLAPAQPFAWLEAHRHYLFRQAALALIALFGALAAFLFGHGLGAGFLIIAGGLLGAALLLPLGLDAVLRLGAGAARAPVAHWFWADGRQQLPSLSVALMALFVALSTNVGVGSMVEGFRKTFLDWLDQRLIAEVYYEAASDADAEAIAAWLAGRKEVSAILPLWRTKTRIGDWPVEVMGLRAHETYSGHFPLLSAAGDPFAALAQGDAVLISEQLARRLHLSVGATIDIPASQDVWRARIAGVYPDYGNTKGQLRVDIDALARHWPDAPRTSWSLRVDRQGVQRLMRDMAATFGPRLARAIDQASLKAVSADIFEHTFAVTGALNALTLLVAAIAMIASLRALGAMRLAQLAPVWALGVPRRRLMQLELLRVLLLAAVTSLAAMPVGLFMSWCLVTIVNVEAFGWRLPFFVFPAELGKTAAVAVATACCAAVFPLLRLARTAPAELLKVFANER